MSCHKFNYTPFQIVICRQRHHPKQQQNRTTIIQSPYHSNLHHLRGALDTYPNKHLFTVNPLDTFLCSRFHPGSMCFWPRRVSLFFRTRIAFQPAHKVHHVRGCLNEWCGTNLSLHSPSRDRNATDNHHYHFTDNPTPKPSGYWRSLSRTNPKIDQHPMWSREE